jgi:PAS domain S-box-containing protein
VSANFLAGFSKLLTQWRARLVVWGFAVGLLGLTWWFALASIEAGRALTVTNAERDLANITRVTQEHAARTFQAAEQLLNLVQSRYEEAGEVSDLAVLAARGVANADLFNLVGVIDPAGFMMPLKGATGKGTYVGDREHFKVHVAADNGQVFFAQPFFGRVSGKWSMVLSRRLNSPSGAFAGVVFVALKAEYFTRFYGDLDLGHSSVAALVGLDGITRLRRTGDGSEQFGIDVAGSPIMAQLGAGRKVGAWTARAVADGIERSYYFRQVVPYPLVVVAGISTAEIQALHEKNRESLLLAAGFASLLVFGLAITFTLHDAAGRKRDLLSSEVGLGEAVTVAVAKRPLRLVFVGFVLFVPILGWLVWKVNAPQFERDAHANLESVVSLKAEAIETWLGERYGDAAVITHSPGLVSNIAAFLNGDTGRQDAIRDRLQTTHDVYRYANIQILDLAGGLRFSLSTHSHVSSQARALFGKALESGQVQFAGLFTDAADGEPQIDFVVPLFDWRNGQRVAIGVMVLHSDPRHFLFPYIQRWPTSSASSETLLVQREGDSAIFLNPLRHSTAKVMSMYLPLADSALPAAMALKTQKAGVMAGVDYRGVPVLAAYRPVKGTGWVIVGKVDRSEIDAPMWRLVAWISLVAVVALGLIGLVLQLLWRQQEQARQYEAQASRLLANFYDLPFIGMAITSPETRRWVKFNDRLCQILGYSRDELPGKTWAEMTHPDDLAKDVAEFERVLSGESEGYDLDKRFIRKDGKVVDCELAVRCVRRQNGSVDFILATVQDISERIQARRELLRSNQELEQFSYSISHDMRQPLRMISSYLQLLDMGLADRLDNEQREYLDFAVDGARRLDQMLVGLLEYSRVGRKGEPAAWVDSRTLLDEALLFLRPAIAEAQADVQLLGEWPRLRVRPDEFLRLLQNLIGNALKFRVAGRLPEVHISSRTEGGEWRLSIADNGVGIAAGQIGRLFQVFQRLQSRIDYEGTGIGLAICRKIVEHHGGRIWVESAGEGQGSRFCVTLPVRESESPEQPLEPALLPGALA